MRHRRSSSVIPAAALGAALLAIAGCGSGREAAPAPAEKPAPESPVYTYTIRGIVTELPKPDGHEIWILHEAVPDFRGADGSVVGMDAMKMPFDLDEGVSLDGIEVGDKVRFTLEIRGMRGRITAIERLPGDTVLEVPQE